MIILGVFRHKEGNAGHLWKDAANQIQQPWGYSHDKAVRMVHVTKLVLPTCLASWDSGPASSASLFSSGNARFFLPGWRRSLPPSPLLLCICPSSMSAIWSWTSGLSEVKIANMSSCCSWMKNPWCWLSDILGKKLHAVPGLWYETVRISKSRDKQNLM